MKDLDVMVIGAGLAGLQLARLLGESGLRILLVDRKPSLDQSVHTTGIFVRRTLEDFSLPEHCLGPPVRDVTLYSPARRKIEFASRHDEFRVGRMGLLYQRFLDNAVRAGVEWMPGTKFAGYTRSQDGLTVRLEGSGGPHSAKARYLVGGDGARSRVATALGLDENREWIVGVEEVLENVPLEGRPRFHCFLDPHLAPGYLAWAVHDGEEVHVGVGGYPGRFDPAKALSEFRAGLDDILDLSQARLIERRGGRIPVGGVLRRIANSDGLLIGDAAGAVSPLTAGGLDPCLRLSSFAAKVIVDYLQSENADALKAYSGDLFRARFVSRIWMRRVIARVGSSALTEVGCALLSLPVFYSFARHVFFGRGSFPDVAHHPSGQTALRLKPQPGSTTY
ncbi:MAG TPA: NAD(P)/FAD-dependent oxidoreductase [Pyrinomonadaceae bacterium]|nr:NAD(P)/FAD-dependent oxidoreductase [Pyrinomonadaceae bacterium]